jgi:methylglyoxal synthase
MNAGNAMINSVAKPEPKPKPKPKLVLYASPQCCEGHNLRRYKRYFNVAWFVRAYKEVLAEYDVITTKETWKAVLAANSDVAPHQKEYWQVPEDVIDGVDEIDVGFDAQVKLASIVATKSVDRLLMFQDPDDIREHLPEAHALIRNCTLANVSLNINAGATFWAETEWRKKHSASQNLSGFGPWRLDPKFQEQLSPSEQTVAFIAHDSEKPKMSRLIYHYREQLRSAGFRLTGTSGTCQHARQYFADKDTPHWEVPNIQAAGAAAAAGHGPTGGDVVIADDIIRKWPNTDRSNAKAAHDSKPPVRDGRLSHTVIFFIDHLTAQPHQADIHVLLRTCLHPSHGVHLLLNERTAVEWAQTLRDRILSSVNKSECK